MPRTTLFAASIVALVIQLPAQDCGIDFVTRQFRTTVQRDVEYTKAVNYRGVVDTLRMNIWMPVGDGLSERPLIVFAHGGGFMAGHRNMIDNVCRDWAARGYVAATISYRLGFVAPWPKPMPYAYDRAEIVRTCARATADMRTAIRFLRSNAGNYRISTEDVFVGGMSAGAITALHTAYMTEAEQLPEECGEQDPCLEKLKPLGRPDLRLDFERPGPGSSDVSVKGCISYYGGILDTLFIRDSSAPALFAYHQLGDPVVGCGAQPPLWGTHLGLSRNYPVIHGAYDIDARMSSIGMPANKNQVYIHAGPDHGLHDHATIDSLAAVFLANRICPRRTFNMAMPAKPLRTEVPTLASDLERTHATDSLGRPTLIGMGERWLRRKLEKRIVDTEDKGNGLGQQLLEEGLRRWTEGIVKP